MEAGESTKYFAPFLVSTSRLTQELALDQAVLERFLKDGADHRRARSPSAATTWPASWCNTNAAMDAIGDESVALQRALELLPGTLRKANTTFVNLRTTLDDLDCWWTSRSPPRAGLAPVLPRAAPAGRGR